MAMVNNGITITAGVSWNVQNTTNGIVTANNSGFSYTTTLTSGTGATVGTADLLYAATLTIAGAGTSELDVAGGITDFFGNTITMARLKAMYINLATTTLATHIVVGDATNEIINWISAAGTVTVRQNGVLLLCAPDATAYAVTAATGDDLLITNGDAAVSATVNIALIGGSA